MTVLERMNNAGVVPVVVLIFSSFAYGRKLRR